MKTGEKVRAFYNATPFPDYELSRFNDREDLKISASSFAKIIDRSIPKDASIIDVGTGTGQLSAFLSLRRKNVWGIDFSDSSLKKAKALKEKLKLDSLTLKKVDITNMEEINQLPKFDYVLCMGVLHHTGNAKQSFNNVVHLMKEDGKIAVGLYNKFGRMLLKVRIVLAKTVFKNNQKVKDYFIRLQIPNVKDKEMARGWWNDQYLHPHETTHTIGEVLRWFRKNKIKFNQVISTRIPENLDVYGLWVDEMYPYLPIRVLEQAKWIYTTHKEGGYFIMFGKKQDGS